mmetsp:Transcript_5257/g.16707  ORF Transcript_5257/g.16707 Transcript_5257/m.16707 type:complete len:211 (-) Transcript_5257:869-1501(-)
MGPRRYRCACGGGIPGGGIPPPPPPSPIFIISSFSSSPMSAINFSISAGSMFITSSGDMFTNRSFAAAFSSARFLSLSSLVSAVDGGGPIGSGGGPPGGGPPGGGAIVGDWTPAVAGEKGCCSPSLPAFSSSPSFLSPIINILSSASSSLPVKNPIMRSNSVSSAFISTLSPVGPTKTPVSVPSNLFCGIPYAVFILTTSTFASFPCGQS